MPGFQRSVLPLVDNQSAFWSLVHNGTTERRNGNGKTATAERQNGTLETRH